MRQAPFPSGLRGRGKDWPWERVMDSSPEGLAGYDQGVGVSHRINHRPVAWVFPLLQLLCRLALILRVRIGT